MGSNIRWSKRISSVECDLVLNIWKMGRRSKQQWTMVTNMPSCPGIYFRDHFLTDFLRPAVLFCWMAIAQVENNCPLLHSIDFGRFFLSMAAENCSQDLSPQAVWAFQLMGASQSLHPILWASHFPGNTEQHQAFCGTVCLNQQCLVNWIAWWNEHCYNPK